jgi:hypothetical protein
MRSVCISSSFISAALALSVASPADGGVGRSGTDGLRVVDDTMPQGAPRGLRDNRRLDAPAAPTPQEGSSTPPAAAPPPRPEANQNTAERGRRDRMLGLMLMRSFGPLGPFGTMGHW